ncbi:MAG: hypothetical protein GXX93_05610 [Anaerolineae bacterium]|nr:hypothetical protein [Anaerolineae bacterium]
MIRNGLGDGRSALAAAVLLTALSIVVGRAGWLGNASDFGSGFFLGLALVAYVVAILRLRQGRQSTHD